MLIFFANTQQYVDHLLPLYEAYEGEKVFLIQKEYADVEGSISFQDDIDLKEKLDKLFGTYVISSYGNLKKLYSRGFPTYNDCILIEHGAGQVYISDIPSWARKPTEYDNHIKGFLGTNRYCVEAFQRSHPNIPCHICGCAKLDTFNAKKKYKVDNPLIVFSWHWDCKNIPETKGGFDYWKSVLPTIAKTHNIAIHGHPRIQERTKAFAEQHGIRFIKNFKDVIHEADIYACDNSSTLFEFACYKPVIVLNNPWFRKDIEHGMRFWEFANIGVQCDDINHLDSAIREANDSIYTQRRVAMRRLVYPYFQQSTEKYIERLKELDIVRRDDVLKDKDTVRIKKNGIIKIVPYDVYLSKWKALGFEEVKQKKKVVKIDYESMTFQELKALATERGMKYYRSTSKKELIELCKKGVGNNDLGRS